MSILLALLIVSITLGEKREKRKQQHFFVRIKCFTMFCAQSNGIKVEGVVALSIDEEIIKDDDGPTN